MRHLFHRLSGLLSAACLLCLALPAGAQMFQSNVTAFPDGSVAVGIEASYIIPRNAFGMDFKPTTGYELYCQLRNKHGNGPLSARAGAFYMDLQPRLDTIPTYLVKTPPTTVLPGYLVYHKLTFMGGYIDYAYSLVQYRRLRIDIGLGVIVGKYHMEYNEGYATELTTSAKTDELFVGFRPRMIIDLRLNKHFDLFADYKDAIVTKTDWSEQFSHNSFGLGLNFTFNSKEKDD